VVRPRFLRLRETAFARPESYFHRYASLSDGEAIRTAEQIWHDINERNLVENVLPTRGRATLVLTKGADHAVRRIRLRKL
jgi:type I pantothenate kinase